MGAVLGDSQKISILEHSWLTHILAISGGIEDDVELAIVQSFSPGHTARIRSLLRNKVSGIIRSCTVCQYLYFVTPTY